MHSASEKVIELFVATDQRDWIKVGACFAGSVLLDYSSMTGTPAAELSAHEIISNWKMILPDFESMHHQLGNFQTDLEENRASVSCYGTATHFLADEGGNLWAVVGSYDFTLVESALGEWVITEMRFNLKYQTGNLGLPQKAINRLK